MANKDVANKGRQYLLLANEDLMSLAGHGYAGAFAGLYEPTRRGSYATVSRSPRPALSRTTAPPPCLLRAPSKVPMLWR